MPLLDHFHPPVSQRRNWEGFHALWAAAIVETLNRDVLAEEYFADMHVHVGSQVEVDVATLEETQTVAGSAAARQEWEPGSPQWELATEFPDEFEVQVFATAAGANLAAAVELVSPGNKDRPETRRAFAAKCVAYLSRGVGVVVVDVVTNRLVNLHNEIVSLLGEVSDCKFAPEESVYAVAYRPVRRDDGDRIEMWPAPLKVGEQLPTLPLALLNSGMVPLDLETTYNEACDRSRLRIAA
jgi:hypothetical protein